MLVTITERSFFYQLVDKGCCCSESASEFHRVIAYWLEEEGSSSSLHLSLHFSEAWHRIRYDPLLPP